MSSTYGLLCLSHDPAVEAGPQSECGQPEPMLAAAGGRGEWAIAAHEHCDLMVARYSYPLVAVACVGKAFSSTGPGCYHSEPRWMDAAWLRVLAYAYRDGSVPAAVMDDFSATSRCWNRSRISRLAHLLDVPPAQPCRGSDNRG